MALKKYTLYFKGKNVYGHEHNFPVLSLDLKNMDRFTSNYINYRDLFDSMPSTLKNYIKDNLCYEINVDNENLGDYFFITDGDFKPIMNVIFKKDTDVLLISEDELKDAIINVKMNYDEFQRSRLKSSRLNKALNKYEFFKYLYDTYVKNQKIACMIDTYDVYKEFPNLSYDEIMIAAIATDKDNITILCKKLSQSIESRRNLALKFKTMFKTLENAIKKANDFSLEAKENQKLNVKDLHEQMISNLNSFKRKYDKEYETLK